MRFHHTSIRYRRLPGYGLTGARACGAFAACTLPILLGFLLPGAALLTWSIETAGEVIDARFLGFALNSFTLAILTSAVAVGIAVVLAYGTRLRKGRLIAGAIRIAGMGYAVPGAVIAVGILLVSSEFDNTIDAWLRASVGLSSGLIFTGTVAGIVFAYLVRFLAISLNTIEASLTKITPNMDSAARTLGHRPLAMLHRVHVPLMWGSLLTAATLVFVDVMKELPATIIMRPFNFDTLAIRAYQLASDEQLAEASPAALGIVFVGIVPVVLLSLAIARSRPGSQHG